MTNDHPAEIEEIHEVDVMSRNPRVLSGFKQLSVDLLRSFQQVLLPPAFGKVREIDDKLD